MTNELLAENQFLRETVKRQGELLEECRVILEAGIGLDFDGKPKTALGHQLREWTQKARTLLAKLDGLSQIATKEAENTHQSAQEGSTDDLEDGAG